MQKTRIIIKVILLFGLMGSASGQGTPNIKQTAKRSTCSNIVALSGAKVDCRNLTPTQQKALENIPAILKMSLENQDYLESILKRLDELKTPQPPVINYAPGGFATSGGTLINPQVTNLERPYRHLTQAQKDSIKAVADSLPADSSFLHIEIVNDPEALKYGNEIADFFREKTKAIGVGLSYPSGMPEGVAVVIDGEQAPLFPTAQKIANAFFQSGIPVNFTKFKQPKPGTIYIVVGVRPEN